jgi:hypothetical protein
MTDGNDISMLRDCWEGAEPPPPGMRDRARTVLLARIARSTGDAETPARTHSRSRSRGRLLPVWAWRTGIAALAAAALAVVGAVTLPSGGRVTHAVQGPGATLVVSASGTNGSAIELAASYAAAQPFTAPRPDQWIYIETKHVAKGAMALSKGAVTDSTSREWKRADGTKIAALVDGKLHVQQNIAHLVGFSKNDYASMAALPSDPQELLALFRKELQDPNAPTVTEQQIDSATFTTIARLLEDNLLPPEVTAALLRAAAAIPGVTQSPEAIAVDGREVIAVGLVTDWMREDILIASDTKEFVGYRGVTVKEHTEQIRQGAVPPGGQAPVVGTVHYPKDQIQWLSVRTDARIVNAPGQTS